MEGKKQTGLGHRLVSSIVYYTAAFVIILLLKLLLGFKLEIDTRVKQWKRDRKQFLMLSGHPSEMDAAVMVAAFWPRKPRIVAGERQMYRKHGLGPLFRLVDCIPKKQFLPDMHAVREMFAAAKNGASLGMMPEGRVSFDGTRSPIDYSTAKLVKKMKLPVAALMPEGTYFVMPPYHNSGLKLGKVTATLKPILAEGEAEQLSTDEIYERICSALSYDQSELAKETNRHYGSRKHPMKNVACMLYRCPSCGAYRSITDDWYGNITCTECGLSVKAGRNMQFTSETKGIPENVTVWNAFQKNAELERFRDPEAELRLPASRSVLAEPTDEDFTYAADGTICLNREGFCYQDESETIRIPLEQFTGVSADYRDGTIIVYKEDGTRLFTFDERQGTAEFMNALMALRELYIQQ